MEHDCDCQNGRNLFIKFNKSGLAESGRSINVHINPENGPSSSRFYLNCYDREDCLKLFERQQPYLKWRKTEVSALADETGKTSSSDLDGKRAGLTNDSRSVQRTLAKQPTTRECLSVKARDGRD
uniref:Uncharacterized protein n=1 Tax=Timema tahoe TaxID=61484 RepID=A0A7R9FIN2_9NEOP|nr:unnamed protein product [Timema tahoe]